MRTFAVVNQKGGCGKTTTAINLSGVLASRGFRTLLVDMDPQGHCAAGLAIPEQRIDLSIGDAMLAPDEKPVDPARMLWRVMRNLDLAPSVLRLAALEASRGELAGRADAEHRLKKVLARFDSQYDACVIDCSPAIGMLAFNALVAADEVIIPVETGFFSLQGASKQVNTIKSLGKRLGVAPVHRLLATMHDPSSALSQDLLDELRRRFAARVIPVVIRLDNALREAASFGQPVIEYSPESFAAQDYSALAQWLVEHSLRPASGRPTEPPAETAASYASPRESRREPSSPEPSIHVVPGVAQLAMAGALHGQSRRAEAAQVETTLTAIAIAVPTPSPGQPALDAITAETVQTLIATPQRSRAADVVARTRRNAATTAELSITVPLTEPKPLAIPSPAAIPVTPSLDPFAQAPRSCGAHSTPAGVIFRQPLTIGRRVCIAGDFNNWSAHATPLAPNVGATALEAIVPIEPGEYQYRLVIDGVWVPDAFNLMVAPNPFGGSNSILIVPPFMDVNAPSQRRLP